MIELKNYRGFKIKYFGATNKRGSRIRITDLRFRKSIMIPFDSQFDSDTETAFRYLESIGIKIIGNIPAERFDVLFTEDFKTELKRI